MTIEAAIIEIERLIGRSLPIDLVSFYSGKSKMMDLPAEIDSIQLDQYHRPVSVEVVADIFDAEWALLQYLEDEETAKGLIRELPANCLGISHDGNGDYQAVSVRDEDFGVIYSMFHEIVNPMDENFSNGYRMADSITDWINRLHTDSFGTVPNWNAIAEQERLDLVRNLDRPWWKFWN